MPPSILVTGGTGYIGSHTVVELVSAGHHVVIVDNLSNSQSSVLLGIRAICGNRLSFVDADVRDKTALNRVFEAHAISAVIHFAGSKSVAESVQQPLLYFDNNVVGTLTLLQAMDRSGVRKVVFSSSATVYGDPAEAPVSEHAPLQPNNPYGESKVASERLLRSLQAADPRWQIAVLRYFNPVGAHESARIGERPVGSPNNLMPLILQVAAGMRSHLDIYGSDYPTPDGTGVRDYIHVVDLARGHLAALRYLDSGKGSITVNLGSGRGISVLELIGAFSRVTGQRVPYRMVARRAGDVATCFADSRLAMKELGWRADLGVERMCMDAWRWQTAGFD